jgi:hypothetical protein
MILQNRGAHTGTASIGSKPKGTGSRLARQIVAVDAELDRINDSSYAHMGRSANDRLRARRGALQTLRVDLAGRLRAQEVDLRWALRDR